MTKALVSTIELNIDQKFVNTNFKALGLTRSGIELTTTVSGADALSTTYLVSSRQPVLALTRRGSRRRGRACPATGSS